MARTPSTSRRRRVGLRVLRRDPLARRDRPLVPWALAALVGGMVAALAGYLLALGASTLAWLAATDISYGTVATVSASFWLLAHGAPVFIGPVTISVAPLGYTVLIAFIAIGVATFAAGQARAALAPDADDGAGDFWDLPARSDEHALRRGAQVVGLFTLGYVVAVSVPAAAILAANQASRAGLGALGVGLICSLIGAVRGFGLPLTRGWPAWLRAVPAAVGAALLVLLAGGALLTGIALTVHWRRVAHLTMSLQAGTLGGIILLLLQVVYLPNIIGWSSSWMLGAGFTLGRGSIVTPVETRSGLLPGIPVLGGLPANGAGGAGMWWLLGGVAAGAVAAVVIARARRHARFDEVALVGGLAGALSAGCYLALVWLTGGDLGTGRLSGFGPRMAPLAVMAVTTLGLAGLATGLVIGLTRRAAPAGAGGTSGDAAAPS